MNEGARQLGLVEAGELQAGTINVDDLFDICPAFAKTYKALKNVMAIQTSKEAKKMELAAKDADRASTTWSTSRNERKRSAPPPSTRPSKRAKGDAGRPIAADPFQTPDRLPKPGDPNYSGESTESKAEYFTEKLLNLFLEQSLEYLRSDFRLITWQKNGLQVELVEMYIISSRDVANCRGRDQTKVKLGVETIVSINDGGISFGFTADGKYKIWQPHGHRPILSLEVARFIKRTS